VFSSLPCGTNCGLRSLRAVGDAKLAGCGEVAFPEPLRRRLKHGTELHLVAHELPEALGGLLGPAPGGAVSHGVGITAGEIERSMELLSDLLQAIESNAARAGWGQRELGAVQRSGDAEEIQYELARQSRARGRGRAGHLPMRHRALSGCNPF
jgi:hypothetical protein